MERKTATIPDYSPPLTRLAARKLRNKGLTQGLSAKHSLFQATKPAKKSGRANAKNGEPSVPKHEGATIQESSTENERALSRKRGLDEVSRSGSISSGSSAARLPDAATEKTDGNSATMTPKNASEMSDANDKHTGAKRKRTVHAVEAKFMSDKERSLAGAPEGELFEVTLKTRQQLSASECPQDELRDLLQTVAAMKSGKAAQDAMPSSVANTMSLTGPDQNTVTWAQHFAALDQLRCLCLFHRSLVKDHMSDCTFVIQEGIQHIRSTVIRNALLASSDLLFALKEEAQPCLVEILPAVIQRSGSDKKFIQEAAATALSEAVQQNPSPLVLGHLLLAATNKSPAVVTAASVHLYKFLRNSNFTESGRLQVKDWQSSIESCPELAGYFSSSTQNNPAEGNRATTMVGRKSAGTDDLKSLGAEKKSNAATQRYSIHTEEQAVLLGLSKFLRARSVEGKSAATKSLKFVRSAMKDNFEKVASSILSGSSKMDVMKASENAVSKSAKVHHSALPKRNEQLFEKSRKPLSSMAPGKNRLSLKERMMMMKAGK